MNKGELIDTVANKADVTKKQADSIISATIETIMEAVAGDDKVTLVGFGSFEARNRKAREGRNPKTMEKKILYWADILSMTKLRESKYLLELLAMGCQ